MENRIHRSMIKHLLIFAVALHLGVGAKAQTFNTLHSFAPDDGGLPVAGVIISGNTLYGTTPYYGGAGTAGTVYKLQTDGTGFNVLHVFPGGTNGGYCESSLLLVGNILYGTAHGSGVSDNATVFAVNTDGTGFTNLHVFAPLVNGDLNTETNGDGAYPFAGLVLIGDTLYGTASAGGPWGQGTVFSVRTNGTAFTNLYNFNGVDGASPVGGLVAMGNRLFGTTSGGSVSSGTLFAMNSDGSGFTNLYYFTATSGSDFTNIDGAFPQGSLTLSGNMLFGTTFGGGISGRGTIFSVTTNGEGFTVLHSFGPTVSPGYTNGDGAWPFDSLVLSSNTLYGTASGGGAEGVGTVFAVNVSGSGFTVLRSFSSDSNGSSPLGGLVLSGNTFYGTAQYDGSAGNGTIFSITMAPQLTITPSGTNVLLNWPTNIAGFDYGGFTLQSAADLTISANWITVPSVPSVINGQNTVTNRVLSKQRFFRLCGPAL